MATGCKKRENVSQLQQGYRCTVSRFTSFLWLLQRQRHLQTEHVHRAVIGWGILRCGGGDPSILVSGTHIGPVNCLHHPV
jgi:hypothetical protein